VLVLVMFAGALFSKFPISPSLPSAPLCNDGSPYFYYLRRTNSSNWLFFLQGGGYCFDKTSCENRMKTHGSLMTSTHLPNTLDFSHGILSSDPSVNPHFSDWNAVNLPYCTSDIFSGNAAKSDLPLVFLGSRVLPAVISDLKNTHGLADSADTTVLLTGSSAGAEGLFGQVDNAAGTLLPKSRVFGLVDSGWFLDSEPYSAGDCSDEMACSCQEGLRRGQLLWKPQVDATCAESKQPSTMWQCSMGKYVAKFITTPLFFFEYRFDWAQLQHDGIRSDPSSPALAEAYAEASASNLTQSFADCPSHHSFFVPTCYYHAILKRPEWTTLDINGTKLPDAVYQFVIGQQRGLRLVDYSFDTPNYNPTCPHL